MAVPLLTASAGRSSKIIARISGEETEKLQPDFTALKKSLDSPDFQTTEQLQFIKTEFEKIIFELEAIFKVLADK